MVNARIISTLVFLLFFQGKIYGRRLLGDDPQLKASEDLPLYQFFGENPAQAYKDFLQVAASEYKLYKRQYDAHTDEIMYQIMGPGKGHMDQCKNGFIGNYEIMRGGAEGAFDIPPGPLSPEMAKEFPGRKSATDMKIFRGFYRKTITNPVLLHKILIEMIVGKYDCQANLAKRMKAVGLSWSQCDPTCSAQQRRQGKVRTGCC